MTTLNIVWHQSTVNKTLRHQLNEHKSCVIWFTGLSGSGKSTLANAVEQRLYELKKRSYILDGDNVRHGLNQGLGFNVEDRKENIRRIAEVSKLFVDAGMITLTSFISPFTEDRAFARSIMDKHEFIEVYVKCNLEECERRDPKGLYQKARNGQISDFTGISSPYEEPENPEILIESDRQSIESSVEIVIRYLHDRNII